MRFFLKLFQSAVFDFSHNKVRTVLTSLGILIGVLSVVLLLAFGLGLKKYIENQFNSLGSNLIVVMPGSKKAIMSGGGLVGGIRFDDKDVRKIQRLRSVSVVSPVFANPGTTIEANGNTEMVELVASNENVVQVFNLEILLGRLLQKRDIDKGDKVVLITPKISDKLYGFTDERVLGKKMKVGNQNYKIIGILKSKGGGGFGNADMDMHVYVPFKSTYAINPSKKYYGIYLKSKTQDDVEEAKNAVQDALAKRYDKNDFSVMEQKEILDTISSIFGVINTVLVAIAAISLVVGGIGIMNIMYVTVTERIKEIGIRRALGARKNDILFQFLIESVILSVLGGLMGLGLAYLIVLLIQSLFPAYINLGSVLLALGVSSFIGVVFGVFPAKKAADLSPIDAIRYE